MSKKCEKCGAPIEGFWAKISKVFGVVKSEKNPNLCNKCEEVGATGETGVTGETSETSGTSGTSETSEQVVQEPQVEGNKEDATVSMSDEGSVKIDEPKVEDDVMVEPAEEVMIKPADDVMEKPVDDVVEKEEKVTSNQ